MRELVQLERRHDEFATRRTRIIAASMEGPDDARKTQSQFSHLAVLADEGRGLSEAAGVIHLHASPEGADIDAPTTVLVDRGGVVRWLYRSPSVIARLSPDDCLRAIDEAPPMIRMTIGRLMVAVAVVALLAALALAVPPTIDPLLRDRAFFLGRAASTIAFVLVAGAVAVPVIIGAALACGAISRARDGGRLPVRRLLSGLALFAWGLSIAYRPLPLDGLRHADRLNAGTFVAFYHQYRLWPGQHVIPCFEIMSEHGTRTNYPLNPGWPCSYVEFRTNADRTMVWVVDSARPSTHPGEVLCSLDLSSGRFIDAPGPFPEGVSKQGGFPIRR